MALSISELANACSVGVETVRYYQRRGLLFDPRPGATGTTGRRHYGVDELHRLRFIRSAQRAGFTLEEISELLALDAINDRSRVREMANQRIDVLDRQITELAAARAALSKLANDCAATGDGPCPILKAFDH